MSEYDDKSALIVVDVQNDFADPNGSLYVRDGEAVVPVINKEIEQARAAGALVVYTQDWHPESTPHFEKDGGIWPVHCVHDTWGAEFHPELNVIGELVRKGTGGEDGYSGFTVRDPQSGAQEQTALESILRRAGIEKVVVAGLATDYCVKSTAADALQKELATIVLRDGIRAVELEEGDAERALDEIKRAGGSIE